MYVILDSTRLNMSENTTVKFTDLGLSEPLLRILEQEGYITPTPIQAGAIPDALNGRDVLGIAQTGTGKTLAFMLPILERLANTDGVALVLAPTRELALQIEASARKFGADRNLRVTTLIGGAPMGKQISQLRARPRLIIATPGRLVDHLRSRNLDLRKVQIAVLDEADRMLDMGFAPTVREILNHTPASRQTLLFSATMPDEISGLAAAAMKNPIRVEVSPAGSAAELVTQELMMINFDKKLDNLSDLLYGEKGQVLVFARTRHGARKTAKAVREMGHAAVELHSDRTLAQRKAAMDAFRRGEARILVATDIAARGIDVKDIALVINFDLPDNPEDYVHRIGRTGRAGADGRAITLATPDQEAEVRRIEKVIRRPLPLSPHSPLGRDSRPAAGPHRGRPNSGGRGPSHVRRPSNRYA